MINIERQVEKKLVKITKGSAIMMTKRERFMNFLQNKPVDRVPVAFFHHFCPTSEWGTGVVNPERNSIPM